MTSQEFKTRRQKLRLSQKELARELGISRVMVGLMERGQREISLRTQSALQAVRPKSLSQDTSEPDPLRRYVERSLIDAGINFTIDHEIDGSTVDFYIPDHHLGIYARRSTADERLAPPAGLEYIVAIGKRSTVALGDLIRSGRLPPTEVLGTALYA